MDTGIAEVTVGGINFYVAFEATRHEPPNGLEFVVTGITCEGLSFDECIINLGKDEFFRGKALEQYESGDWS